MEFEDYKKYFLEQIRSEAEHNSNDPENEFIAESIEQLEDIGELADAYEHEFICTGKNGRIMAFDGYGYDEADSSFVLIISDFQNTAEVTTLTQTTISNLYNRMRYFVEEAYNGRLADYCDDSDATIDIAKELKSKIGKSSLDTEIMKFKFYIITNSALSKGVKSVDVPDLLDRPVELNLWDLERFFRLYQSQNSETITIRTEDFNCKGIPAMKVEIENSKGYTSYMGIVEGRFLANIYLKYGSRLLQGNVRAFLSARGKVNKKIRATINSAKDADQFFTYNNGISTVANNVELSANGRYIISFNGLQIINGGQTTASLANAIVNREAQYLDKIYVPMKLTVLNVDHELSDEELDKNNLTIQKIAECANTQNPVSDADFFSNHPFHVIMENLSANILAPPVDGTPYPTRWFYERSRGKWEQEQMKLTPAQTKHFREKCPKKQLVKKEKLAKCLNTIECNPHQVAAGSANNMKYYGPRMIALYEKSKDSINEVFFKKAMASVIIFDEVDNLVNKSEWYPVGGNKAQIVPYTIAKIISMIPKDKNVDYNRIWQKQHLYPSFVRQVEIIAPIVHQWLLFNCEGVIIREFAKKADTWKKFQDYNGCALTDEFLNDLVSTDSVKDEERAAKKRSMFDSNIDLTVQIYKKGAAFWQGVAEDLNKYKLLSYGDREFVLQVASLCQKNSLLTTKQAFKLKKIIEKAVESGLIIEE